MATDRTPTTEEESVDWEGGPGEEGVELMFQVQVGGGGHCKSKNTSVMLRRKRKQQYKQLSRKGKGSSV